MPLAPDYCTHPGAERLKAQIERYWRERGYTVTVTLHEGAFTPAMRSTRTDVRSDMVGGLPKKTNNPKRIQRTGEQTNG